jgi:hypothetical protein
VADTPLIPHPTNIAEEREAKLKVYDRILATVSAIGLILGGIWGVYTYAETRRKETEQRADQAASEKIQRQKEAEQKDREIQLRRDELDRQVFTERKATYLTLSDAACEVVACRDRKEVEERSKIFLKLYFGRAHIIAEGDSEVEDCKIAFKDLIFKYLNGKDRDSTKIPFDYFGDAAYKLTKACKVHIDPRSKSNLSDSKR